MFILNIEKQIQINNATADNNNNIFDNNNTNSNPNTTAYDNNNNNNTYITNNSNVKRSINNNKIDTNVEKVSNVYFVILCNVHVFIHLKCILIHQKLMCTLIALLICKAIFNKVKANFKRLSDEKINYLA